MWQNIKCLRTKRYLKNVTIKALLIKKLSLTLIQSLYVTTSLQVLWTQKKMLSDTEMQSAKRKSGFETHLSFYFKVVTPMVCSPPVTEEGIFLRDTNSSSADTGARYPWKLYCSFLRLNTSLICFRPIYTMAWKLSQPSLIPLYFISHSYSP